MEKKLLLKVEGMHCQSCEKLIAEMVKELRGVKEVHVSYQEATTEVKYDDELTATPKIVDAIMAAGYTAAVIKDEQLETEQMPIKFNLPADESVLINIEIKAPGSWAQRWLQSLRGGEKRVRETLPVAPETVVPVVKKESRRVSLFLSGMHCSSCAGLIERALSKHPAVKQANVNFASEKASVVFDESQGTIEDLVAVVKKTGYSAELAQAADNEQAGKKRAADLKRLRNILINSVLLSLPMLYLTFDFRTF